MCENQFDRFVCFTDLTTGLNDNIDCLPIDGLGNWEKISLLHNSFDGDNLYLDLDVIVQGNLDPSVLYASPDVIKAEAYKVLDQFKGKTGHVFNLGHGITPDVNPESMKVLVDAVHSYSDQNKLILSNGL